MHRRDFLNMSLATLAIPAAAAEAEHSARQFYLLRAYRLQSGPQTALTERYLAEALLPALNRLGMSPVGAFRLDFGPETPTLYTLIPSHSVEALATLDLTLAKDDIFLSQATSFWSSPATAPAFLRTESTLLAAFEGWPKITPPDPHKARVFQLRTYESPSHAAHIRKIEMFHHGEFEIFAQSGFGQVFYGDTLVGTRLPSLSYMLTFPDHATMDTAWNKFRNAPAWKKLSTDPRYSYEELVSNITNLLLNPLPCSQI